MVGVRRCRTVFEGLICMEATISGPHGVGYGDSHEEVNIGNLSIGDAVYHTAHRYPGGVHALAARMARSGDTLSHKVNPNNTTHHLTLEEAVMIQELSGCAFILQAEARRLGYVVTKAIPASSSDPVELHWQMAAKLAELHHAVADAFAHGVTRNSMRRCDGMASEAIGCINNMLAALRAQLPTPPKTHLS